MFKLINCFTYWCIHIIYSSQDNILSDEEAKEIKKLLSPDNDQLNISDWMSEVLSIESNDNVNNQRYSCVHKSSVALKLIFFKMHEYYILIVYLSSEWLTNCF